MSDCATAYTLDFIRRALPDDTSRILEVGCGNGALATQLQAAGLEVVGLDSEPACVEAAVKLGIDARLACWPDFSDGQFDAVLFTRSLHHVDDLDAGVAAAFGALRTGGRVIVEDFDFGFGEELTLGWFSGLMGVIAASGVDLEASAFLSGLIAGDQSPLDVWHAQHDHELHPAAAIDAALRATGASLRVESSAYFFRYLAGIGAPVDALCETLRVHELFLIAGGRIQPLGRRFVAEAPVV